MGAYLSQPVTKKVSSNGQNDYLSYGESSMQGWRVSQEDAHNSLPELHPGCALFAVYDGHGGHEVAAYTAQTLPGCIQRNPLYSAGQVREGLRQAFLDFDGTLTRPEVIEKLKAIAGRDADSDEEDEADREVDELYQEAHMPLEELVARYQGDKPASDAVGRLKAKEKPLSPFLRAKPGSSGAGTASNSSVGVSSDGSGEPVQKDLAAELNDAESKPEADAKSEADAKPEADARPEAAAASDVKPEPKTNGAGGAAPPGPPDSSGDGGGGTAARRGKGGKGARPGSGNRATRRMPERAAAEIYRDVLEGARLAREAGHADEEAEDEEEEEDDDFSLEQSDSLDDDEDDADGGEDSDEEEEEEDEEDSEQEDEDSLGDEEEAGDDEDGDFMLNMKDEPGSDSGCTAVVALLHGRQLYVANIGDSRCVLSRSGRAVDMSADHKPEDEAELQRIVRAGGKVTMDGRVNGGLNLSRAFGDHAYKADKSLPADQQMISASPDVRCVTVEPDTDEFMVLACDGIWNSKKSQEVVDFVSERIREQGETQLSNICEELFDECLAPNTMGDGTGCDNMTCIIVRFLPSLAHVEAPAPTAVASAAQRPAEEPPEKRQRTE
ncbi:probable protein phosphatase 2C 21 [Pollicipes pollicipes]|uniref:probable protein phosphatase 2C 21 n=1 Tax=Pollicipes pollicipes TaxID=41117 RepID=UPI0018859BA3|nr:probable protein phosphatase 2C 21 [Pollicipes pollicipes]